MGRVGDWNTVTLRLELWGERRAVEVEESTVVEDELMKLQKSGQFPDEFVKI